MSLFDEVDAAKKRNIDVYKIHIDRLFSDYREEEKTIKDYNGRQILELLQNADDEDTDCVEIFFDSDRKKLNVSNKGNPFTVKGFESLLLANNSSKTNKKKFIGNKGLGFRSILNWAKKVEIISAGIRVGFSKEIACKIVERELSDKFLEIEKKKKELNYRTNEFPYPILSLPEVVKDDNTQSAWSTIISIEYNAEFEEDIKKQLDLVSDEILLFVRNIGKLNLICDGNSTCFSREIKQQENFHEYTIDRKNEKSSKSRKFNVYKKDGEFPEEFQKTNDKNDRLYYEIAIAVEKCDFPARENFLYSFFKTDVKVSLPCLIHGSFELNSSRNQVVVDGKNDYVWGKIADLLLQIAKGFQKENFADWKSFDFLSCGAHTGSDILSSELVKFLDSEPLYPCFDDKYRKKNEVFFYSSSINREIEKRYAKYFPEMLKEPSKCFGDFNKEYSLDAFYLKWEKIAKEHSSLKERVDLIKFLYWLIEDSSNYHHIDFKERKFALLLDENETTINCDEDAYTPAKQEIEIPSFVNVKFIKKAMFSTLAENIKSDNIPRELCQRYRKFVNIHSYDISDLTPKIISQGKKKYEETKNVSYIKEMVKALYQNYLNFGNGDNSENKYDGVMLVTRDGSVVASSKLYFSSSYELGRQTEEWWGNVLGENEYLIGKDFWEIKAPEFEEFLKMLGVNVGIRIEAEELTTTDKEYYDKELRDCNCDWYVNKKQKPSNKVYKIMDNSKLKKLTPSQIVVFLLKNEKVKCEIMTPELNKSNWRPAKIANSYIAFQLKSRFRSVLMDCVNSEFMSLLGPENSIDYKIFEVFHIEREVVNLMFKKLGASKELADIPPDSLYSLVNKIPDRFPDGKKVQGIYEKIYDSLKVRENVKPPENLKLACKVDGKIEYRDSKEIYYSDNASLPRSILKKLPILLFRSRAGAKQLSNLFKVKQLETSSLEISNVQNNDELTNEFMSYFSKRNLYILAYRLYEVERSEDKESYSNKIKKLTFRLIQYGEYSILHQHQIFDDYDFLLKDDIAYIKVPDENFEKILKHPDFEKAFCEVISMHFSLRDSVLIKTFKAILRDEPELSKNDILEDYGQSYLEECQKLLGMTDSLEIQFWNNIFQKKNIQVSLSSAEKIEKFIESSLNIQLPKDYNEVDFFNLNNRAVYNLVKLVCQKLNLTIKDVLGENGLEEYYKRQLENIEKNDLLKFKGLFWNSLNKLDVKEIGERKRFGEKINEYERCVGEIDLNDVKFEFDVDMKKKFYDFIKTKFSIDLNESDVKYEEKNFYLDILPEDKYIDNPELKSLSRFEGYEEIFKGFAQKLNQEVLKNSKDFEFDSGKSNVGCDKVTLIPRAEPTGQKSRINSFDKAKNVSAEQDKKNKKVGKEAEKLVIDWLKKNGYQVNVKSSLSGGVDSNDAAHYDLEYRSKDSENWRFLDVKHVSAQCFEITSGELNFAFENDNKNRYDLALVKDGQIKLAESLFKKYETQKSFLEKFHAYAPSYKIPFEF